MRITGKSAKAFYHVPPLPGKITAAGAAISQVAAGASGAATIGVIT
jgi:hypothetical protein